MEREEIFKALFSDDDSKLNDFRNNIRKYLLKFIEDAQVVVREMLFKPEMLIPRIKSLSLVMGSLQLSEQKLTDKVKRAMESGLLVGDNCLYFNELD